MFKKVVKYENYEGEMKAKTLYFNISKTEIIKMRTDGTSYGILSMFKDLADSFTVEKAILVVDALIDLSYGERSDDGESFRKSGEILARFKESAAYDALFEDLCNTEGSLEEFFGKVFPKEVVEAADKVSKTKGENQMIDDMRSRMEETMSTNVGIV